MIIKGETAETAPETSLMSRFKHWDFSKLVWIDPHKRRAFRTMLKEAPPYSNLYKLYSILHKSLFTVSKMPAPWSKDFPLYGDTLMTETPVYPAHPDLALSIVTITRNDLHVERMEDRTQAFIDGMVDLAEKHKRPTELILVEWNPPKNRPSLRKAYHFPVQSPYITIRIVTVPADLHAKYRYAEDLPLYQMIGKNVGIRRARGRAIMVTNVDILLSEQAFLAASDPDLKPGHLYRSNRWDIDISILDIKTAEQKRALAPQKCLRINCRDGVFTPETLENRQSRHEDFDPDQDLYPVLNTEGCGDFQLMLASDWYRVRGYLETDCFSYHTDSLFSYTCHFAGLTEIDWADEKPHFHIDHQLGTATKSDAYVTQQQKTLRHISCEAIIMLNIACKMKNDFPVYNKAYWGLSHIPLGVENATKADWDTDCLLSYNLTPPYNLPDDDGVSDYVSSSYAALEDFPQPVQEFSKNLKWLEKATKALQSYIDTHAKNRPLMIWGTGQRGEYCLESCYAFSDLRPENYVCSASEIKSQTQTHFMGLPVIEGHKVCSSINRENRPFILIASMFGADIALALETSGYREGLDFIIWI